MLKRLLGRIRGGRHDAYRLPDGERIYAIGDIHGRYDLLDDLLGQIHRDDQVRGNARTLLVFLGDYINRGPQSREVIARLIALEKNDPPVIPLMGNYEEVLLHAASGDRAAAGLFHRIGGRETLLSYGVTAAQYDDVDLGGIAGLITAHIPADHLDWLERCGSLYMSGDYLFVHAGLRPSIPVEEQSESDLRWIRADFLDHRGDHGAMVVHGHSISGEIDVRPNRIGLDTGAYQTGRLTALGLEGDLRWFLQT